MYSQEGLSAPHHLLRELEYPLLELDLMTNVRAGAACVKPVHFQQLTQDLHPCLVPLHPTVWAACVVPPLNVEDGAEATTYLTSPVYRRRLYLDVDDGVRDRSFLSALGCCLRPPQRYAYPG